MRNLCPYTHPRWRRLGLKVVATCVASVVMLSVLLDHQLHPDNYLLPSRELSALPLRALSWVDVAEDGEGGGFFTPRHTEVFPLPKVIQGPAKPCRDNAFLAVIVPSHPQDRDRRRLARGTWIKAVGEGRWPSGEDMQERADVFFVLGGAGMDPNGATRRDVDKEAADHGDLIMGDFTDTYRNLTSKTLTGLSWVRQHCPRTAFTMKLDQDTFVDFPRLLRFLASHQRALQGSILGKTHYNSPRLSSGKWSVTPQQYPYSTYPAFVSGPIYVVANDAMGRLVDVAPFLPAGPLEDVHVTGVLTRAAGVRLLYVQQMRNQYRGESLCLFLDADRYQVNLAGLTGLQLAHVWRTLADQRCRPFPEKAAWRSGGGRGVSSSSDFILFLLLLCVVLP